jgi:hypothetical protein
MVEWITATTPRDLCIGKPANGAQASGKQANGKQANEMSAGG